MSEKRKARRFYRVRRLSKAARWVLAYLLDAEVTEAKIAAANAKPVKVKRSITRIARGSLIPVRTARHAMEELMDLGFVTVVRPKKKGA